MPNCTVRAALLNALVLSLAILPAPANASNRFWNGGGDNNNWSNVNNWASFFGPPANDGTDDIIMQGTLRHKPVVDTDYQIDSLQFSAGFGDFEIQTGQNDLFIGGGGIINNNSDDAQIISRVSLSANHAWNAAASALIVDSVALGGLTAGHTLTITGGYDTIIRGAITGSALTHSGSIVLNNTATLTFGDFVNPIAIANNFTGPITVNSGTLVLDKPSGSTAVPGNLIIGDGAGSDIVFCSDANQIADTSNVTVNSSGRLRLYGFPEAINNLTINGGSVTVGDEGVLNVAVAFNVAATALNGGSISIGAHSIAKFNGPLQFTGARIVGTGTVEVYNTIVVNPSAQTSRIAGNFVNFVNTPVMNIPDGAAADDFEIANLRNGHIDKSGPGRLVLSSANTSGNVYVNGGPVVLRNSANFAHLFLTDATSIARFETSGHLSAGLHVNAGKAVLETGGSKVLVAKSIEIDTTDALIDVWEHAVIIDYTGGSPIGSIRSAIIIARNGGTWNGFGITSSLADATHGVGYAEAGALGLTSFAGEAVDATSVLVKFTYFGDANLDGQVNVTDLGALATHWQTSADWTGGDFNYDGFVDVTDLGALATNWQAGVGNPLAPSRLDEALAAVGLSNTSVPEPATLIGILAFLTLTRRRADRPCVR